jgi:cell division protein FtsB
LNVFIDGAVDKAAYEAKSSELRASRLDVEQRIANLGTASNDFYDNVQQVMEIARNAP